VFGKKIYERFVPRVSVDIEAVVVGLRHDFKSRTSRFGMIICGISRISC
jgi:hypothetical protein